MSERTREMLKSAAYITIGILLQLWGYSDGLRDGRGQMKHWQDDWYAAHPVVREVRSPICGSAYDIYVEYDNGGRILHWKCTETPAPQPSEKPQP